MKTATAPLDGQVRRFLFEERPVRGHWVHLGSAWRELRAHRQYPPLVDQLLGHAVAACALLAATLKFRGTLTFQLQGDGLVSLLVAQCTEDYRVRAMARFDDEALAGVATQATAGESFRQLTGRAGRITVTVEAEEKSMRYQGVVPLTGDSLAESLEAYFASSEQLPTRLVLAADAQCAAGMLVQLLPGARGQPAEANADAWQEAQRGMRRITPHLLLGTSLEAIVARVFPKNDLRLFQGVAARFECRCNQGRVAGILRSLGSEEIREVLREQGSVTVTCEFCQRPYAFDYIDIEALFADGTDLEGPVVTH
jgi:molecular chaperone Hsp33